MSTLPLLYHASSRHWSLGQVIGGPDAIALTRELAQHIATHRLNTWIELLEPRDCCVAPVLTVEEAREHVLFRPAAQVQAQAQTRTQAAPGASAEAQKQVGRPGDDR